jgi:predicted dehydrogenase
MVNLGIAGLGHIGRIHLEASGRIENARVVAVATSRPEDARGLCSPDVFIYTDYGALLRHPGLDAVVVCLPTFLHEEYVRASVESGLHVLCEKPLALDAGAAERMIGAAGKARRLLMAAQVLRFWPQYVRIRELADSSAIGPVCALRAYRLAGYPRWASWFRNPEKSGGCLLDLQIHDVDFIYCLLGFPAWVSTVGIQSPSGSWDHVSTTLQYSGAVATVEASYLMPESWPFSCGIRVTGATGCLEFQFRVAGNIEQRRNAVEDFLMYGPGGAIARPEFPPGDMYALQLHYFADCLERGEPPTRCPPRHSLDVMRIMDACRRSVDTGQAVKPEAAEENSGGHSPGV